MTLRKNQFLQEREIIVYDHAQVTANTTIKLFEVAEGRKLRIEKVTYVNPTGLTVDVTNFYDVQVIKGAATVLANWSTETGQEGLIPADQFIELVNSLTDLDMVVVGGAPASAGIISLFLEEGGVQTLPAGRIVIEGVYV